MKIKSPEILGMKKKKKNPQTPNQVNEQKASKTKRARERTQEDAERKTRSKGRRETLTVAALRIGTLIPTKENKKKKNGPHSPWNVRRQQRSS